MSLWAGRSPRRARSPTWTRKVTPATCDPADIEFNRHCWEQKIFYCGDVQCKDEYPSFTKRIWAAHDVDEVSGNMSAGVRNPYLQYSDRGVNLIGYTTWGCIDVVSAGTGEMRKRYGFIYVDMDDKGGEASTAVVRTPSSGTSG